MRFAFISLIVLSILGCDQNAPSQALGTLERDRVILTATANEIVRELPIKEGQYIEKGDVLVKLDTTQQHAILARAKADEAKADAYLLRLTNGERVEDIAAAQAQLSRANAMLVEARLSYQRTSKLVLQKLASFAEKDKARAEKDGAQADYDSAKENYAKMTNGERPEDIKQAQASLEAANAEVALQQQILNDLTVTATRNGVLDSLPYNVGERVPMNGIVAAIQADTVPYARVYVPEPYRVKLKAGDSLVVHVDGLDNPFTGTLRWIATEPSFTPYYALNEEDRARLVYLAEIDLPIEGKDLPAGVPAQVEMPANAE
jgi:HlyD family secretion protein